MGYIEKLFGEQLAAFRAGSDCVKRNLLDTAYRRAHNAIVGHDFKHDDVAARRTPVQFAEKFDSVEDLEQRYIFALNTAFTYNPERVK